MTERLSHIWIRIAMPMLLAIGFFAAVSVTQSAGEENTAIRIGFLLKTMQEERYQTDRALFIARAESLGLPGDSGQSADWLRTEAYKFLLDRNFINSKII